MTVRIDHVTIAASRLEAAASAFAGAGLDTEYGGHHSNGATHMSLLGFEDGSYIELVSVVRPGLQAPRWQAHIAHDAGPCAWSARVDDIAGEAARLRAAGVTVDGPHTLSRKRPDGQTIEWDVAYVGDDGVGALHPFLISDRTPRSARVTASAALDGAGLTGVEAVIVGVADPVAAGRAMTQAYGDATRQHGSSDALDAELLRVGDTPIVLASPASEDGWLARRLGLVGMSPCAIVLASRDLAASRARFPLADPVDFGGRALCWFQSDGMWPLRIAVAAC